MTNRTEILTVNGKATLYLPGGFGWHRHEVRDVRVEVGPYAQHARAYFLTFTPKGARKPRSVVYGYKPRGLVCAGHGLPEMADALATVSSDGDITVRRSRHMSCSPAWDDEARAALANVPRLLDLEAHAAAAEGKAA